MTAPPGWQPTLGAIVHGDDVSFSVWAPRPREVRLLVRSDGGERELRMDRDGEMWHASVPGLQAGDRYAYLLDGQGPFPDPCSRSQPEGVHEWSEIVDPAGFGWTDGDWQRRDFADLVIYEAHIGTLTPGGTFDTARDQLPRLASLGVTAVEVMPVAAFPGRWNWGYDGVDLFAPFAGYGGPDGMRRFVDAAHAARLAVILDVVYNHFGPDGNYTGLYSNTYLTERHQTPWGAAINFDGPGSEHVREFYFENLAHWAIEYHIDGFRFDATHAIIDSSPEHILAELSRRIEQVTEGAGRPYLIAESHENDVRYLLPREQGGFGFDAVWADDFHHAVRTTLTGEREGYLRGFDREPATIGRTIEQGFLYEGQFDAGFEAERGTPARSQPWGQFVYCIQNHDQVGNRAYGQRLHHTVGRDNVFPAAMLLLLLPQTPLLFQGQEFLAAAPFLYFTDHNEELGTLVTEGRRGEFKAFRAFQDEAIRQHIPDPQDPRTFERSLLDLDRGQYGIGALAQEFYRALIDVRREDPVLRAFRAKRLPLHATAHGRALHVEFVCSEGRRSIIANFGEACEVHCTGRPEVLLHSAEARFGGPGHEPGVVQGAVRIPARSAAFLSYR
jgi:maltooligosyltrehalose trehalohydrolase